MAVTVESVLDGAAELLGDGEHAQFSTGTLLGKLKIAIEDLQEKLLEISSVRLNTRSDAITVPADTSEVPLDTLEDMIEPIALFTKVDNEYFREVDPEMWERSEGGEARIIDRALPYVYAWSWRENKIFINKVVNDVEVIVRYRKALSTPLGENSNIDFPRTKLFLQYQTAGLVAEFDGENPTRAQSLYAKANMAWEEYSGIEIKSRQAVPIVKRGFGGLGRRRRR